MIEGQPKRIKVLIYPNQLEWIDRIGQILNQSRRQTFQQCFCQFIGAFIEDTKIKRKGDQDD
jgi:hypothetical protein